MTNNGNYYKEYYKCRSSSLITKGRKLAHHNCTTDKPCSVSVHVS